MFKFLTNLYRLRQQRKIEEIQRQQDLDNQRHQLKMRRLELEAEYMSKGKPLPENLDQLSMEQMERTHKDEIIMAILFSPIIMVFFDTTQATVAEGFKILATIPDWYVWLLAGIVVVTYGLRGMLKFLISKKKI